MMLTHAIKKNYVKKLENVLASHHVALLTGEIQADHDLLALPCLGKIKGVEFLKNENLSEEVFGPFALCIEAKDFNELQSCIAHLEGQLTFSIFGGHDSIESHTSLIELAKIKAGRILLNNVPTGVEVCDSMVHGGPFPATSDTRFTSVGSEAIFRWYRPICFQNFPDILLPDELKRSNPLNLSRKINGVITTESL
jgi:NADP-dependent aldehyde dehydrogenase